MTGSGEQRAGSSRFQKTENRKQKTENYDRGAASREQFKDEGREEFAHGVQKVQEGHYSRKRSGSTESAVLYEYQY